MALAGGEFTVFGGHTTGFVSTPTAEYYRCGKWHTVNMLYPHDAGFGTLKNSWRPFTEDDYQLSEEMLDAWTNFCKDATPGWPAYKHLQPYKKDFNTREP